MYRTASCGSRSSTARITGTPALSTPAACQARAPGLPGCRSAGEAAGEHLLAHLGTLAAVGLRLLEEILQLGVTRALGVLDVDVQAESVVQARLDVPDEVVVLVLRAGDVAGLGG